MKNSIRMRAVLLLALGSAACASAAPPAELMAARASYSRAQHGAAATLNPADLHTAQVAITDAENWYTKEGDTQKTRDLAYVADRRAQIAEARAKAMQSSQRQQQAVQEMHSEQTQALRTTSKQLDRANQQLALQNQAMQSQDQQLAAERQAREDAERRAAQAAADLAKFASVKQEARG